jgi:putative sterol carrier protein
MFVMLILKSNELHLGDEVLQVRIEEGVLQVQQGEALNADVVFHTPMQVFVGLFAGQIEPDEAILSH